MANGDLGPPLSPTESLLQERGRSLGSRLVTQDLEIVGDTRAASDGAEGTVDILREHMLLHAKGPEQGRVPVPVTSTEQTETVQVGTTRVEDAVNCCAMERKSCVNYNSNCTRERRNV